MGINIKVSGKIRVTGMKGLAALLSAGTAEAPVRKPEGLGDASGKCLSY